jgi:hypothetical protein
VQDPECLDQRSKKKNKKKNGTTLKIVCAITLCMLSICCNDCVCYISCSAPNNLLEQYYVDTTFASILERAANLAKVGDNSRNQKIGGGRRTSTIRTSIKQKRTYVSLSQTPACMLGDRSSTRRAS